MNLQILTDELIAAKPFYMALSPTWPTLFTGRLAAQARMAMITQRHVRAIADGMPIADAVGGIVGDLAVRRMTKPARKAIRFAHVHVQNLDSKDMFRKNGLGGRTWVLYPGKYKMVMVFHDAYKAGPHVDVHIGRLSLIYRVKPEIRAKLRFNSDGVLTQDSKKILLDFVREEVNTKSRVPQNLDHTVRNARASWYSDEENKQTGIRAYSAGYGAASTRQVFHEADVQVFKHSMDGAIEMFAPTINPHRGLYLYRLYPGDQKRAPILIWGALKHNPPDLHDRLHLKLVDPKKISQLDEDKADMATSTAKYDGSSAYIVITPKGTTVWSPRKSAVTGQQIEYTHKIPGISNLKSDKTIIGMGEVLFKHRRLLPGRAQYTSQATGAGILNSNLLVPDGFEPEIRLYRIDKIGRETTVDLPFWQNRALQEQVAKMDPERLKVVELMTPVEAITKGFEGVVVIPPGGSVNDGLKTKWWQDPNDWRIDSIEFEPGPKGGIAGVVRTTSLDSGKKFKLGPGQVGDRALNEAMMRNPENYIGTVLKVASRHGHEGRAAKVIGIHADKGTAPPPIEGNDAGQVSGNERAKLGGADRSVHADLAPSHKLLLDSPTLFWRAYYGLPDTIQDDKGNPVHAVHGYLDMVAGLTREFQPDEIVHVLDQDWRPSQRVEAYPGYKLARTQLPEPPGLGEQYEILHKILLALGHRIAGAPGWEAEDAIASLTSNYSQQDTVDIVTGDRDLLSLVRSKGSPAVSVLFTRHGVSQLERFDDDAVRHKYGVGPEQYADYAILRGDPSDELPGVKGIGPKRAADLINTHGSIARILSTEADERVVAAKDYLEAMQQVVPIRSDVQVVSEQHDLDLDLAERLAAKHNLTPPVSRLYKADLGKLGKQQAQSIDKEHFT